MYEALIRVLRKAAKIAPSNRTQGCTKDKCQFLYPKISKHFHMFSNSRNCHGMSVHPSNQETEEVVQWGKMWERVSKKRPETKRWGQYN